MHNISQELRQGLRGMYRSVSLSDKFLTKQRRDAKGTHRTVKQFPRITRGSLGTYRNAYSLNKEHIGTYKHLQESGWGVHGTYRNVDAFARITGGPHGTYGNVV